MEPAEALRDAPEVPQAEMSSAAGTAADHPMNSEIRGKVQRLGDFVDTDAVSPRCGTMFRQMLTYSLACTCSILRSVLQIWSFPRLNDVYDSNVLGQLWVVG